jgi:hypothetical protein
VPVFLDADLIGFDAVAASEAARSASAESRSPRRSTERPDLDVVNGRPRSNRFVAALGGTLKLIPDFVDEQVKIT